VSIASREFNMLVKDPLVPYITEFMETLGVDCSEGVFKRQLRKLGFKNWRNMRAYALVKAIEEIFWDVPLAQWRNFGISRIVRILNVARRTKKSSCQVCINNRLGFVNTDWREIKRRVKEQKLVDFLDKFIKVDKNSVKDNLVQKNRIALRTTRGHWGDFYLGIRNTVLIILFDEPCISEETLRNMVAADAGNFYSQECGLKTLEQDGIISRQTFNNWLKVYGGLKCLRAQVIQEILKIMEGIKNAEADPLTWEEVQYVFRNNLGRQNEGLPQFKQWIGSVFEGTDFYGRLILKGPVMIK